MPEFIRTTASLPRVRMIRLLAAALLAATAVAPAEARQKTALNDDPRAAQSSARIEPKATEAARVPYQAYLAADCIDGSNFCKFTTEVVPPGRRLELHRAACQGWHSSSTAPNFVVIAEQQTEAGVFVRRIDFWDTRYTRVDTNTVWSISEEVLTFIPARHKMLVRLNSASTGVGSYGCTISGYLVQLQF